MISNNFVSVGLVDPRITVPVNLQKSTSLCLNQLSVLLAAVRLRTLVLMD